MEVSIDSQILDELNTKESRKLHETINSLRAYGVDRIVNLPQIIVVGDQSSGKSSVLEALCHVRFPVKDGLCTRFATELVLQPAAATNVKATVRYFDQTKAPLVIDTSGFDENDLPKIIEEAKKHMGVAITDKGFTRDVLRLEIQGPKMYPLTVIDLPGFFYVDTETQSLAGKSVVDQLVLDYMSKKESIILNVIAGNQPLANQDALSKVKAIDPSRDRTIGVITKPDLMVARSESEAEYAKLVTENEGANKLRLGWHVLRNSADVKADLDDRHAAELDFFKTGVWETVPQSSLGISNLRKKLSRVLHDHIRKSLPEVIINIEKNLKERRTELGRLGPPRSDTDERRSFLINIASQFQSLAKDGVDGRYDDPFFGDLKQENHKFRAQLRNFNRAFQHILWTKGSSKLIHADGQPMRSTEEPPEHLRRFLQTYPYDFPDPIATTELAVHLDLQRQASINQGKEFPGHSNKDLAIKLFQEQAKPWDEISRFHVKQVTFVAKAFVDAIFEHILGSADTNRTTEAILSTCVDPWFSDQEKILQEKLDELLQPYHDGYTVALDAEFHAALSKKSKGKIADRVYKVLEQRQVLGNLILDKVAITNAILEDTQLDGGEFGTQTAVDMMLAYYESARGTFAVNVINLAIERCLISGIPKIFTATQVSQMPKERLDELAAETDDIKNRREVLDSDIKVLESAFSLCQRYRPRAMTKIALLSTPPATSLASRLKSSHPAKAKESVINPGNTTKSSITSGSPTPLFSMPDKAKGNIVTPGNTTKSSTTSGSLASLFSMPDKAQVNIVTPGNATKSSTTSGSPAPLFSTPDAWKSQNQSTNKAENNNSTTWPPKQPVSGGLFSGLASGSTTNHSSPFAAANQPQTTPSIVWTSTKSAADSGRTTSVFSTGKPLFGSSHTASTGQFKPPPRVHIKNQVEEWNQGGCIPHRQREYDVNGRPGVEQIFQHICSTHWHKNKSPEELRLAAYTPP